MNHNNVQVHDAASLAPLIRTIRMVAFDFRGSGAPDQDMVALAFNRFADSIEEQIVEAEFER